MRTHLLTLLIIGYMKDKFNLSINYAEAQSLVNEILTLDKA